MKAVGINGVEIKEIKRTLETMVETIDVVREHNFTKYFHYAFYENGRAKELLQRVLHSDMHVALQQSQLVQDVGLFDILQADYSGKVQMLVSYYQLLSTYVDVALESFEEQEEQMKKRFSGSTRIEEQ